MEYLARKRKDNTKQSFIEHSRNVAHIASDNRGYSNTLVLAACLHDLGKISNAFQVYLLDGGERGSVVHALQGAFYADETFSSDCAEAVLLKEIIELCVSAHHNHLNDCISPDGEHKFWDRLIDKDNQKYSYTEIKNNICEDYKNEIQELFDKSKAEIGSVLAKIKSTYKSQKSANFALGLFVKYIYSCLVDADRLDARLFAIDSKYELQNTNWDELIAVFETNISKFEADSQIAKIRKTVSDKCKAAAQKPIGIYHLSVPTGGGKTLSSLRFALHHCRQYNKKRIIYVIPYLSIIEQTAESIRNILNLEEDSNVLLEHHSNIIEPDDEGSAEIRKLSASRWDSPIIITTMVQFLESVMSSKASQLRKFNAIADSVIIFDEIQSLPIKTIHCFNEIISYFSSISNSTILLCTATQPALQNTQRTNLLLSKDPDLIDCKNEFSQIRRVNIVPTDEKDYSEAANFILEKAEENRNCLAIVNTKKAAREIYQNLRLLNTSSTFEILHLSTSMCSAHRMDIINKIKSGLKNNKKLICITTQLIEAGVDISFFCVIRATAGLDSIAQAGGRCNRNGESIQPKNVYVFKEKDENLDRLPDIKSGKETTEEIIRQNPHADLFSDSVMNCFYQKYFEGKDDQMDYLTKDGESVYAMLSGNCYGKKNLKNKTGNDYSHILAHAFRTADMNFSVIDNTKSVVVYYGEAENLLTEYKNDPPGIYTKEKGILIKKLQKHSVSLFEYEIKKLTDNYAITALDEETGIMILDKNYYSQEIGVVLEIIQDNLII